MTSFRKQFTGWWVLMTMTLFFLLLLFGVTIAEEEYTDERLKAMSEKELEQICLSRGFEIMRDEIDATTGLPHTLSHDDFVEAAKRCLAIEDEMNALLAEYPELAKEIEEEIKKLEAEQTTKRNEVQQLEKELAEAQAAAENTKSSTSGSAFLPPSKVVAPTQGNDTKTIEEDDFQVIDDGDSPTKGKEDDDDNAAVIDEIDDFSRQDTVPVDEMKKSVAVKNKTGVREDFTVSAMTFEIIRTLMKQVESDVRRIVDLVGPVLQPILRAGDVAWRHLKVVFESLRTSPPTDEQDVEPPQSVAT